MTIDSDSPIRPVILCGGSGTRLWPLSTAARPKQFLPLVGEHSLLHETFARLSGPAFAPATVICSANHVGQVSATALDAGEGRPRVIAEPSPRNTAAAVALAAVTAADQDELLLILPSDHHIERPEEFRATVERARAGATAGLIVTFGMAPTRAETGFGYVEMGEPLVGDVGRVDRFVEKPDAKCAQEMVASGGFLWNGGIFFARAGTLIEAFESHCPELLDAVRASLPPGGQPDPLVPDAARFAAVPAIAFDHAVMEKFARVGVIPSDFGWSDVGSWTAAYERSARDPEGNAVETGSTVIDGGGNLLRSTGPRIVALGVDGLMVLATDEAVLVAPLSDAQRVREAWEWFQRPVTDRPA